MSSIPNELKYSKSHEWVRVLEDGNLQVGITEHAQELLGDLVFVELPEMGQQIAVEEEIGVVESVKAASDIFSPVAGDVVAINEGLEGSPELVNQEPYEDGWLYTVKPSNNSGLDKLLSADDYKEHIESEDH